MTLAAAAIAGICLGGVVSLGIAVGVYLRRARRERGVSESLAKFDAGLAEFRAREASGDWITGHRLAAAQARYDEASAAFDAAAARALATGHRPEFSLQATTEPMGPPVPPRLRPPEAHAPAELHPVGWRRPRHQEAADA